MNEFNNLRKPRISAVIPAYNESQGLAEAIKQIAEILDACESAWEIIIVDDGSRDQTYQQICQLSEAEPRIKGLTLSRCSRKDFLTLT
jgi:cellulose synthase/poly-beta-1,6-N-acetylglucosamine synthase-like glycosyltransferase